MKEYNLYNLEASFLKYLNSGIKRPSLVSVKNYLPDLRHFFGWFLFRLKASQEYADLVNKPEFPELISKAFDSLIVAQYRAYLKENKIPMQTSNRRLSTLRKLAKFFISQRWISSDPTSNLRNITQKSTTEDNKYYIQNDSNHLILDEYKKALQSQNLNSRDINNAMSDINEFLNFKRND